MTLTTRVKIYQVESTSNCSATCSFCPHPTMERKKKHMSLETFRRVLSVMENDYIALHHFGEPLLNPDLPAFIREAHAHGVRCEFSTNGYGIQKDDYLKAVLDARPYMIRIAYDFFKPDEFIKKVLTFNVATIVKLHAVTKGLLLEHKPYNNWAGVLPGESEIRGECYYKKFHYACALQDGSLVPCCQDYEGKHVIGHVNEPDKVAFQEDYSICKGCTGMQFAVDGLWKAE